MKKIFNFIIILLPWKIRRLILIKCYHYEIDPSARIGLSYIYPDRLKMGKNATIGHLNVAIHLHYIEMAEDCTISQQNWITGFPIKGTGFFEEYIDRIPQLIMGKDSAITKKHLIDCTDTVKIGAYTSIAGYGTQILSHSTSLQKNNQSCAPIYIGHHCFVGTRSIILPGSVLPDQSVLGAGAVMKKIFTESYSLYGGIPAKFIKKMDETYAFFVGSTQGAIPYSYGWFPHVCPRTIRTCSHVYGSPLVSTLLLCFFDFCKTFFAYSNGFTIHK